MKSKKDGSSKGAFPMIKHDIPWVQCFSCPSHWFDKFIQNALSDSATFRIQSNVMSNVEFTTISWDETLFKNTFETDDDVTVVETSVTRPVRNHFAFSGEERRKHSLDTT
jgi:hypothetical protein